MTEHELERKARVAELLLDAARELGECLEPERIYDRFHELLAADPRLVATALQTVGAKGYDGFAIALVTDRAAS